MVWDIYPQTKKIAKNSIPEGAVEEEIFLGRSRCMSQFPPLGRTVTFSNYMPRCQI